MLTKIQVQIFDRFLIYKVTDVGGCDVVNIMYLILKNLSKPCLKIMDA